MYPKALLLALCCLVTASSCQVTKKQEKDIVNISYVHRYGVPISEKDWLSLGQTGQVETTYTSGIKVTRSYVNNLLDGKTIATFPHSETIEKEEVYKQGSLVSVLKNFPNGAPQEKVSYDSNGKHIQVWYESGNPKSVEHYKDSLLVEGQYFNNKNEMDAKVVQGNGARKVRDQFGRLLTEDTIKNGELALQTTYFPNGDPKSITPYRSSLIHGERKTFYPGGAPQTIEQWESGKQHGVSVSFINGEKSASIVYVNGKKHGVELRYAANGDKVVEEIRWVNGIKHGPMTTYLPNQQTQLEYYFRGRLVSKVVFDELSEKTR